MLVHWQESLCSSYAPTLTARTWPKMTQASAASLARACTRASGQEKAAKSIMLIAASSHPRECALALTSLVVAPPRCHPLGRAWWMLYSVIPRLFWARRIALEPCALRLARCGATGEAHCQFYVADCRAWTWEADPYATHRNWNSRNVRVLATVSILCLQACPE